MLCLRREINSTTTGIVLNRLSNIIGSNIYIIKKIIIIKRKKKQQQENRKDKKEHKNENEKKKVR